MSESTQVGPDSRYEVLFEPVKIGPVTARNRFYQVPHCNGMGRAYPSEMATMRGNKAAGGWAVICTEQCDIHPSSDTRREIRLWDDQDIPYLQRMTDAVHAHRFSRWYRVGTYGPLRHESVQPRAADGTFGASA